MSGFLHQLRRIISQSVITNCIHTADLRYLPSGHPAPKREVWAIPIHLKFHPLPISGFISGRFDCVTKISTDHSAVHPLDEPSGLGDVPVCLTVTSNFPVTKPFCIFWDETGAQIMRLPSSTWRSRKVALPHLLVVLAGTLLKKGFVLL